MGIWFPIASGYYLLIQIILVSHGMADAGQPALPWTEERLFLRAQCKAKCLRLFQDPEEQKMFTLPWPRKAQPLDQCFKQSHELCSSECFHTCDRPPKECLDTCSDDSTGCFIGCLFLVSTLHPRPGECPPPLPSSALISTDVGCSRDCQLDSDCPGAPQTLKCCLTTCGGSMCIQTHLFGAKLDAFERGKMYQFRLAATNSFGTRGFSPASPPYPRQPKSPYPPAQPRNITDALWRFYQTDSVSVLLKWVAPEQSDLPVVEYRVKWVVDHGYIQSDGKSMEGLTEFIKTVPQVQAISYWHGFGSLESLPATTFLSTQSVRHTVQSSGKNAFQGQQTPPFRAVNAHKSPNINQCGCDHDELSTDVLKIKSTFFDNGDLWAMAQVDLANSAKGMYLLAWAPQVCINLMEEEVLPTEQKLKIPARTHTVMLEQLRLNCRYTLHLHQLISSELSSRDGAGQDMDLTSNPMARNGLERSNPLASLCFCTPSCWNVEVRKGSLPANCPSKDPDPPLSPTGVRVEKTGETDYRVLWKASGFEGSLHFNPQHQHATPVASGIERRTRTAQRDTGSPSNTPGEEDRQPIKYRVVWAPRLDEPVDHRMYNEAVGFVPIMDLQQSDVRIVGPKHNSLDLKELKKNTVYIVRIQTLVSLPSGMKLESSPTSIYFATSPPGFDRLQTGTDNRQNSRSAVVFVSKPLWLGILIAEVHLFS